MLPTMASHLVTRPAGNLTIGDCRVIYRIVDFLAGQRPVSGPDGSLQIGRTPSFPLRHESGVSLAATSPHGQDRTAGLKVRRPTPVARVPVAYVTSDPLSPTARRSRIAEHDGHDYPRNRLVV